MADENRKLNVFISYSRDDLAFADQLHAALSAFGFGVTIDRDSISGGDAWKKRLGVLIRDADSVVFVLSPSSARSSVCAWEVAEAVLGKRVFPVMCRPLEGEAPPPQLADLNAIHFYAEPKFPGSGFGKGLADLASSLNTDFDWLREHTRYLRLAKEWEEVGKPPGPQASVRGGHRAGKGMDREPPQQSAGADRLAARFHQGERGGG